MAILILNQFFHPDAAPTAQLAADVADALLERQHEVRVICTRSGYSQLDAGAVENNNVRRLAGFKFGHNPLARLVSYAFFLLGATLAALREPRCEIVLTLTTPPLLCLAGTILKKCRHTRHFIWEMDLYPDVATDLGFLSKKGWPARLLGTLTDYSRRNADGIIAPGECMRDRLIARGIPPEKIHVAENWADGHRMYPIDRKPNPRFTVLYSGNLGLAHDVDTITGAMDRLGQESGFRFVFAGGGARRLPLQALFRDRDNVEFHPYCCQDKLAVSLNSGDVGLVTQQSACVGSVVPSKVYGLMATARPYIFVGPREATPNLLIERFQCGWRVENDDVDRLVALLHFLRSNPELVRLAGANGREAFLRFYDLPLGVARICAIVGLSAKNPTDDAGAEIDQAIASPAATLAGTDLTSPRA